MNDLVAIIYVSSALDTAREITSIVCEQKYEDAKAPYEHFQVI